MAELRSLVIKWAGKEYSMDGLSSTDSIFTLKQLIFEKTNVQPGRQKLLNLKLKGKIPPDTTLLTNFNLKNGSKIMMMGSTEEAITDIEVAEVDPSVANDFDDEVAQKLSTEYREEYLNKVANRVKSYEIKVLHQPRDGKRLLVLDIDYTIFDHRSVAETGQELMRPYLHEFLASAYEDYDIVIWSATNMKWIEEKMKVLGCDNHPNYKLSFYLDSMAMISIYTERSGVISVKPLGVIWGKFSQYNVKNTIMFDDLRRNFLMNPSSGLKIRPFRNAHTSRRTDTELIKLSVYLKSIARIPSFEELDHRYWETYVTKP